MTREKKSSLSFCFSSRSKEFPWKRENSVQTWSNRLCFFYDELVENEEFWQRTRDIDGRKMKQQKMISGRPRKKCSSRQKTCRIEKLVEMIRWYDHD